MPSARSWCGVLACCVMIMLLTPARAYPRYQPKYWTEAEQMDPDEIADMINGLRSMIQLGRNSKSEPSTSFYNLKRGLDLGLSRGYSGALQAKHLMGLAAANFADGPGRRRRDANQH